MTDIEKAAEVIAKARSSYQINESGINMWIARTLEEAGMLTIPAKEDYHVDK